MLEKNKKHFLYNPYDDKDICFDEVLIDDIIHENNIIYKNYNGKKISLLSHNSKKEIELYTKNIDFTKSNILVVCGTANIELIVHLYNESDIDSKIILIEPDIKVAKFILQNADFTSLRNDKIVYITSNDYNNISRIVEMLLMSRSIEDMAANVKYIINPNYYMYRDFMIDLAKNISNTLKMKMWTVGNSLDDQLVGFTNNYLNIDAYLERNNLSETKNAYLGRPAVVVASGPSLDKNIHLLKEVKDKAVILACDASYDICMKYGVVPDAIASIERDEPTYTYYYKDKKFEDDVVLVGPTVLWPDIYKDFRGKKIVSSKTNFGSDKWFESHFEDYPFMSLGFSSAHVAYAHARWLGCDPIILIGQDLAYTGGKKHSDDTHTKYEGDNDARESEGIESYVEDVFGNKVLSDDIYDLFRHYYEFEILNSSCKCIDSTEGGAKIKYTDIMTFRDAIDKYITNIDDKDTRLYYKLKDIKVSNEEYINKYMEIIKSAKLAKKEVNNIYVKAKKYLEKLEKTKSLDFYNLKETALKNIGYNLSTGKVIVDFIMLKCKFVNSYFNAIITVKGRELKTLTRDLEASTIKRRVEINYELMELILKTCEEIDEHYDKLIKALLEKRKERE